MSASTQSDSDHLPDSDSDSDSDSDQILPEAQQAAQYHDVDDDEDEYMPDHDDLRSISPPRREGKVDHDGLLSNSPGGTNDRTIPILKDNPYAEEPTYHTRPNRWYGADSTWLSWTEEERLAVHSLDQVRSRDLSLHLYNAHALNANAKHSREVRRKSVKGKAPVRSEIDRDNDNTDTLIPPRGWTAWPLPPEHVPRDSLIPQTNSDVYRIQDDPQPSVGLEDCIIATTTRLARERWKARSWQPEFATKRQWGIKVEHDENGIPMDEDLQQSPVEESAGESDAAENVTSDSDSDSHNAGDKIYTSQAYDLALDDDVDQERKEDKQEGFESLQRELPVPIADDAKARDILLPTTRQILGNFDHLLMGLHRARQAYAPIPSLKRAVGNRQRDISGTESEVPPAQPSGRKRKRRRTTSVASNGSTVSGSTGTNDPDDHKTHPRRPNPRDWSDVIGMAALTGWDPAVVERASRRCASLFNENMLFRTFHEGSGKAKQASCFTEHEALDDDEASELEIPSEGFTAMIRMSQACKECHAVKEKCEPQEDAEGNSDCKRCARTKAACSGITVKIYNDIGRSCPYKDCERHTIPFRKAYHLQRHLDSVHQSDAPPASLRSGIPLPVPIVEEQPKPSEIICPVSTCTRHKQPFARGTKLYEHLRKMHPEIDIKEVKKLEAARRGEKRGRYRDESRRREIGFTNRSRSKSVFSESRAGSDGD